MRWWGPENERPENWDPQKQMMTGVFLTASQPANAEYLNIGLLSPNEEIPIHIRKRKRSTARSRWAPPAAPYAPVPVV